MSSEPSTSRIPSSVPPSLLFLILDLHPLSWSLLAQPPAPALEDNIALVNKATATSLSINDFLNALTIFLNAHLASAWGNDVVVYGATAGKSKLLYPMEQHAELIQPNMYHPFRILDTSFEAGLKSMIRQEQGRLDEQGAAGLNDQPAIVSALTKALCYINRVLPSSSNTTDTEANNSPNRVEPRIMVVNATPSSSPSSSDAAAGTTGGGGEMRGGYVGLMNCVFAAQKAKVPIDVLTLPPLSGGSGAPIFLQQAAHLTEGVYWRWNGRGGLLQYLHSIYLAPPALRHKPFAVPPQDAVDFRAVCFCHHNVVDVGFVCSVCLSIFCEPKTSCLMCKTKFPLKAISTLKALASNIKPIPIPQTIPPPPPSKKAADGDGPSIRLTVGGTRA